MNAEWLQSYVVFAEHLSFTSAARELHISQPALHVQIRKLADELGVSLYRKVGRSLQLTPQGEKVLAFGREQRERTDAFLSDLHDREARRNVVLTAGEGAYLYLLGPAIQAFKRHKAARLNLLTNDRDASIAAVLSGEAHLGVGVLDHVPDGLAATKIVEVGATVMMPRRHQLASKRKLRVEDLQSERLVVPPEGRPHRVALSRHLMSAGVDWEPAVEASGWGLLMHFARLGLGLAVVNDFCPPPGGMVSRPLPALPKVPYYLFHQRGRGLDEFQQALMSLISQRATN